MITHPLSVTHRLYILLFLGIGVTCAVFSCQSKKEIQQPPSVINTAHLDHLYEEIKMGDDTVGIIHIYSEYPDYHHVGDSDEGIACVDDASRAAIFYLLQYRKSGSPEYLHKAKMLLNFLLHMAAPNGYYYNFIWPDGSINKEGNTSRAEPTWWAWRTLWAYGVAVEVLSDQPDDFLNEILERRRVLMLMIVEDSTFLQTKLDTAMGFNIPTWLPGGSATDQASLVMVGLTCGIQEFPSEAMKNILHHFAEGIMMMQVHQKDSLPDGAFLSWENLWHAYGNMQSYALLFYAQTLHDSAITQAALYEIDHFYPAILKVGGLDHFWMKKNGDQVSRYETAAFNQIAYGRSPMIWAALQAHALSGDGDKKYLDLAGQLAMWFFGENPANAMMYDPETGRGYDGIKNPNEINKNSGAESTIESLLALQAMERYNIYYDPDQKQFKQINTLK
jgi:hypothetical protein